MNVGIAGLGRMGAGVAERLVKGGHSVVVQNRSMDKATPLLEMGATGAATLHELVAALPAPRIIWLYLPAGSVTDEAIYELTNLLEAGDILIDGGNSRFAQSQLRGAALAEKGIHFMDVGTSGGIAGREVGYCLMVGGSEETYSTVEPLLVSVAQANGVAHVGPIGAGHYVKMVHNAIEYGMMQAYGEGVDLLETGSFAGQLDLSGIADLWQQGSIIRSFLGELLADALRDGTKLADIAPVVEDNGEGRWTVEEALIKSVPVPVIAASMFARYESRRSNSMTYKVLAALRKGFGGHAVQSSKDA
jgi:6-phosphogluconate dehydrogenase